MIAGCGNPLQGDLHTESARKARVTPDLCLIRAYNERGVKTQEAQGFVVASMKNILLRCSHSLLLISKCAGAWQHADDCCQRSSQTPQRTRKNKGREDGTMLAFEEFGVGVLPLSKAIACGSCTAVPQGCNMGR